MTCFDVPKIQEANLVEHASLYDNAFGANLPLRRAMSRPVFRALAAFGIGSETTNAADGRNFLLFLACQIKLLHRNDQEDLLRTLFQRTTD